MTERSGTDEQIWVRLKRGDTVTSIRNELGCGYRRVAAIARAMSIKHPMGIQPIKLAGEVKTLSTSRNTPRCTPWTRVWVPMDWATVTATYSDDGQSVTLTKASSQ